MARLARQAAEKQLQETYYSFSLHKPLSACFVRPLLCSSSSPSLPLLSSLFLLFFPSPPHLSFFFSLLYHRTCRSTLDERRVSATRSLIFNDPVGLPPATSWTRWILTPSPSRECRGKEEEEEKKRKSTPPRKNPPRGSSCNELPPTLNLIRALFRARLSSRFRREPESDTLVSLVTRVYSRREEELNIQTTICP